MYYFLFFSPRGKIQFQGFACIYCGYKINERKHTGKEIRSDSKYQTYGRLGTKQAEKQINYLNRKEERYNKK